MNDKLDKQLTTTQPSLALEHKLRESSDMPQARIVGLDEVGYGALAGPVCAAAVIVTPDAAAQLLRLCSEHKLLIRDSKQLSARQRCAISRLIRSVTAIDFAYGHAGIREIDSTNILRASWLAMRRAINRLVQLPHMAMIDGRFIPPDLPLPADRCFSIIKGDQQSLSIACAAILAKEWRDSWMKRLGRHHPQYRWEKNAGYGTREHRFALQKFGPCRLHRQYFVDKLKYPPLGCG